MDYKLEKFDIENVGAIKRFRCELHGGSLVIAGKPDVGKTTILETIKTLIEGKSRSDREPTLTRGELSGGAEALFRGDDGTAFTAKMILEDGKKPVLKVIGRRDAAAGESTRMTRDNLSALVSSFGVDILKFKAMKPKEQIDCFLEGMGLKAKLDELNRKRQNAYDERRDINRDLKNVNGEIEGFAPIDPNLPNEPINEVALLNKINALQLKDARTKMLTDSIKQAEVNIAAWRKELAEIGEVESPQTYTTQLVMAQAQNKQIAEKNRRAAIFDKAMDLESQSADLTAEIERIDAEKTAILQSAKLPIEGLAFGDDGLMIDGHPLAEHGEALNLKTTFALLAALLKAQASENKILLLTMDGGESLGKTGVADVKRLAKEFGVPVMITYVSEAEGEIEDAIYIKEA